MEGEILKAILPTKFTLQIRPVQSELYIFLLIKFLPLDICSLIYATLLSLWNLKHSKPFSKHTCFPCGWDPCGYVIIVYFLNYKSSHFYLPFLCECRFQKEIVIIHKTNIVPVQFCFSSWCPPLLAHGWHLEIMVIISVFGELMNKWMHVC